MVTTASENHAWAIIGGTSTSGKTIPPGTDISPWRLIGASGASYCSRTRTSAAANTGLTITGGGKESFSFHHKTVADQTSFLFCGLSVTVQTHGDVYFDLTSNSGALNGTLVVTVTHSKNMGHQVCKASVDIGADGLVEFHPVLNLPSRGTETFTYSAPLTLSPTPTKIRVNSQMFAAIGFGCDGELRVDASFLSTGGSITKRANACPSGVDLKVSHLEERPLSGPRTQVIKLQPMPLPASATACVYAFGGQEWQIPLAPTNCLLRNNATVLFFVPPSAPELVLNFPAGTTPITFYGQFAFATKGAGGFDLLHTSDSFRAVLK